MSSSRFERQSRSAALKPEYTLGIDFGTSTTKVAFRRFGESQATLIPSPIRGLECWPTVVYLRHGILYFADDDPGDVAPLRWIKIALASPHNMDLAWHPRLKAEFGCTESDLCSIYLAFVINHARKVIEARFGPVVLTVNVGAPLDRDNDRQTRPRFEKAVGVANHCSTLASPRWKLSDALDAVRSPIATKAAEASQETRAWSVFPEIAAAVTGVLLDRNLEDGHYAAIDIGAGTTDISVFLYKRVIGKAAFFHETTKPVACNDVDREIAKWLIKKQAAFRGRLVEHVQDEVRLAKETSGNNPLTIGSYSFTVPDLVEATCRVCSDLLSTYNHTWNQGYRKEARPDNWRHMTVLLLGGGSLFDPFRQELCRRPSNAPSAMKMYEASVNYGHQLQVLRDGAPVPLTSPHPLMSVVHGLSVHRARLPEYYEPYEVDELPPPPSKPHVPPKTYNLGGVYETPEDRLRDEIAGGD